MASPSISIDDEDWYEFRKIIKIKAMLGELESDKYSPVLREMIEEYTEENREYLEQWEDFAEGNSEGRPTSLTAD